MRRLKSSFTLLSPENPQLAQEEEIQDDGSSNQYPQFSWEQLLSAEPSASSSDLQDFLSSDLIDFSDGMARYDTNVQNPVELPYNPPKRSLWTDSDRIREIEAEPTEILPTDSEQSYSVPGPLDGVLPYADHLHSCPVVTSDGTVSILLRHLVRVDISPDGGIYIQNCTDHCAASVSSAGNKTCVVHSNSRVYQDGPEVHVMTYQNQMAKICQRGIVFASSSRSLAYLVDESGTKSTADRFLDLRRDYSLDVFYDGYEVISDHSLWRCHEMVARTSYKPQQNGDDIWMIGNTQIKQDRYGNIEVSQDYRRRIVTLLPTIGEFCIQTLFVNISVGSYSKRYLTLQMDNRRITSGFCGLTVQNGSQKAGIDRNGKVVIF